MNFLSSFLVFLGESFSAPAGASGMDLWSRFFYALEEACAVSRRLKDVLSLLLQNASLRVQETSTGIPRPSFGRQMSFTNNLCEPFHPPWAAIIALATILPAPRNTLAVASGPSLRGTGAISPPFHISGVPSLGNFSINLASCTTHAGAEGAPMVSRQDPSTCHSSCPPRYLRLGRPTLPDTS